MSERELQVAVMAYLAYALPRDAVCFHCSNEGKRTPRQGAELKRQGLIPGIPDVFVICRGQTRAIELKTPTGRLQPSQVAMLGRLKAAGCSIAVCRSIDEVESALAEWGFPLRARDA